MRAVEKPQRVFRLTCGEYKALKQAGEGNATEGLRRMIRYYKDGAGAPQKEEVPCISQEHT